MVFSPRKLLAGAACFFLAARSVLAADNDAWCTGGPWEDLLVIGDTNDGDGFCETRWQDGIVVTGIEAWASKRGVEGIQFYYSDGKSSKLYGTIVGQGKRLDWDPSVDTVTQFRSWGNGRGQHLGRIEVKLAKGGHLDQGKDTSGQDTFEYNVGSGIMLGAFGTSTSLIESLGIYFLKSKIDKISMDDVVFDETPETLNSKMEGLEIVTLDEAKGTNTQETGNYTWEFGKIEEKSITKTFSTSATHDFGYSYALQVSGKILDIGVQATHTLSYGYSTSKSEESSMTKKVTLSYKATVPLKPGQEVWCRSTAMMGTFKGDFGCKVNIHLEDGYTFGFDKRGTLEQTNWSQAETICQDKPFERPEKKRAMKFIA